MAACVEGRTDHHWHEDASPDRSFRKGAKQVRCCYCDKRAWATMRRNATVCGESEKVLDPINLDDVVSFDPRRQDETL